ncbi:MAG: AAA family ATPase, partial [Blastocatellia bacterium]|nr:AAA family ATPase [Blastocatellia bacterium]
YQGKRSVAITGFMGVGKSSVARHLANMLGCERIDLDVVIEKSQKRKIADIIESDGLDAYRQIESENLARILENNDCTVLSLGGGTWTVDSNRDLINAHGLTSIWLESTFEHCWKNIRHSWKERPLARDKNAALKLFEERQGIYCLADWHFVVKPEHTSWDIARSIAEELFEL